MTIVTVLKRGYFYNEPVTLLQLNPHTGRRHQLRVHLASIGHPIIGDYTYEHPLTEKAERTMLHAWKLYLPWDKERKFNLETVNPFEGLLTEERTETFDDNDFQSAGLLKHCCHIL